ncbi:MAG: RNA polymerase sigma factor RpoH [Burkholderiales bacterium]|jgi:RNA polymerase sigma-32 factor|nr:RNA polymerase sigma factor RpoH [Rhodocyclaceae bacterium]MBV6411943.1 RNA polymerase sigma factor RpoH [Rhodocyclaceae bacterium]MCZ2174967.1 RNA polymerase sigma factor RpoH [Burkholderiales bacterium]MCZ2420927.1 RNA polymerase sigma factor RpoH [Burkholderiales bacterium]GIK45723.1 MAG: RNA polymerase sigma factor RpoH [Betaproteobacteria bacterium]
MTHALNLPVSVAVGNLESYIQAANRFPLLTEQQELDLARRYRSDGDLEAARGLVLSHLRLVVSVARGYLGYGLPHADLIQEGNVGLMKAVKRYDPERGVRLVSFAIHWIKAEIHEYILRNWRLVKIATTKAQRKLFFNLRSLKQGLNTMSSEEVGAVARQLGVKPEEVREMETRLSGRDIAMEGGAEDDDESFAPIAYLADPAEEPSEALANREMARLQDEGLKQALSQLDARSRRIIERRWLAESEAATLHELAAEYGVSAERIRQIEAKAMQKMKGLLAHAA